MAERPQQPASGNKNGQTGRPPGWWKEPFLEQFALSGNQTLSLRPLGVHRTTVKRARDADPEFEEAYQDAKEGATDLMVAEARRRAVAGVRDPVIYQGQQQYVRGSDGELRLDDRGDPIPLTIRKYSDTLLIFLIKGARPGTYRDNVSVKHSGGVQSGPRRVTFNFVRSNRHPDGPQPEDGGEITAVEAEEDTDDANPAS